jgi:hypothetical protein
MRFGLGTCFVFALVVCAPRSGRCDDGPLTRDNLPRVDDSKAAPWAALQQVSGLRILNEVPDAGDRLPYQGPGSIMWNRWASRSDASRVGMPQAQRKGVGPGPFDAKRKPWSSEYWSFGECNMAFDRRRDAVAGASAALAPLEMVDSIGLSLFGFNPQTAAFEAKSYHNDAAGGREDSGWSGHCNGWSAASLLEPEPPETLTIDLLGKELQLVELDRRTKAYLAPKSTGKTSVTLSCAQMKGILTEVYSAVKAVTGDMTYNRLTEPPVLNFMVDLQNRHDIELDPGALGQNGFVSEGASDHAAALSNRDTMPHIVHSYVARCLDRGQPIVADTAAGPSKHNHPIYHYQYKVEDSKTAEEDLQIPWQRTADNRPAPAAKTKVKTQTISYEIWVAGYATSWSRGTVKEPLRGQFRTKQRESDGLVVTSEWLQYAHHPDTMWLPIPNKFSSKSSATVVVNEPLIAGRSSKGAQEVWCLIADKITEKSNARP